MPSLTYDEYMEIVECLKLLDAFRQSGVYSACAEAAGLLETDLDSVRNILDRSAELAQRVEEACTP